MADDNNELDYNLKLPLAHERYRLEGLNAFSLSRWSKENEYHEPHRFKVGDIVRLTITCEVTNLVEDCDGTALYTLDNDMHGVPDNDDIRLATDEEKENY